MASDIEKTRFHHSYGKKIMAAAANSGGQISMKSPHCQFMQAAFTEARIAYDQGETPAGAVVVLKGQIIGAGHNEVESLRDPLAHAEILAMRRAGEHLGEKHLYGAILYSTLEPCVICAGAAILHRVETIVYGAADLRWGGCGTVFNIVEHKRLNHRIEIIGGIMEEECAELLREFYANLRKN